MIRIEFPVDINRPVNEVFGYVTDPDHLAEWQPNAVSVTRETEGPMRKGTRLREIRRAPFGRTVESLVEVSAFEPDRRFSLHIVEGPLPIDAEHEFEQRNGGTRIRFVASGRPAGVFRFLSPLLGRALRRQFDGYYARLREVLEEHA